VDPNNEENKSWKQEGIFDTYEEADSTRAVMLSMNTDNKLLVKVKRCSKLNLGIRLNLKKIKRRGKKNDNSF
jgi:hypothetical protein